MYGMRRRRVGEPKMVKNRVVGAEAGEGVHEHGDLDMETT